MRHPRVEGSARGWGRGQNTPGRCRGHRAAMAELRCPVRSPGDETRPGGSLLSVGRSERPQKVGSEKQTVLLVGISVL